MGVQSHTHCKHHSQTETIVLVFNNYSLTPEVVGLNTVYTTKELQQRVFI